VKLQLATFSEVGKFSPKILYILKKLFATINIVETSPLKWGNWFMVRLHRTILDLKAKSHKDDIMINIHNIGIYLNYYCFPFD
jgi:hypothetical protein